MAYGVKPPPLGDYALNLAESADFMFDHAIYNDCMANVDYSEQIVKETNPKVLRRAACRRTTTSTTSSTSRTCARTGRPRYPDRPSDVAALERRGRGRGVLP